MSNKLFETEKEKQRKIYSQGKRGQRWSKDCSRNVALSWNRSIISVISIQPFWVSVPVGEVSYHLWDPLYVRLSLFCKYLWVFEHKETTAFISCVILRFFSPYCMEISPALIHCIYFNVTSFVLHCELKWVGLQRAGVALFLKNFLTTAVSAGSRLSPVSTFLPTQKHQGNKKRLMSTHKNDRIGADCREDFKTRLSQLMIRRTWVQG